MGSRTATAGVLTAATPEYVVTTVTAPRLLSRTEPDWPPLPAGRDEHDDPRFAAAQPDCKKLKNHNGCSLLASSFNPEACR